MQSKKRFSSRSDEEEDLIRRKRATRFILAVLGAGIFSGFLYLGRPEEFTGKENSLPEALENGSSSNSVVSYYRRAHKRLFSTIKVYRD
jgi:hypothetical protein